jgi:hypothetical protein
VANEPLTGARYPVSSDPTNLAQYYQNLAFDLAGSAVPRFTSTAARATAYTTWMAATGSSMIDGMMSYISNQDQLHVWENGSWRFLAYKGPVSGANAPITNLAIASFVAAGGAGSEVKGWAKDREHTGSCTLNATTGYVTIVERGIWAIAGGFSSNLDAGGVARNGESAVSWEFVTGAGVPIYNPENTVPRIIVSGVPGSTFLRQGLHWTGYLDVGSTWHAEIFQNNTAGTSMSYSVYASLSLVG